MRRTMGDDMGDMGDDGMMMMMMPMTFSSWSSYKLMILFTSWNVQTIPQYIASWILIVLLCIVLHILRFFLLIISVSMKLKRDPTYPIRPVNIGFGSDSGINNSGIGNTHLLDSSDKKKKSLIDRTTDILKTKSLLFLRVLHALFSSLNYGLSLLLMLVAMTYNPGLFLALVVGNIVTKNIIIIIIIIIISIIIIINNIIDIVIIVIIIIGYFFGDLLTTSELVTRDLRSNNDDGCH